MRATAFLVAMLFAASAAASDDKQTCDNLKAPPSDRIAACSAVLVSTPLTNAQMARIFFNRSMAYIESGNAAAGMNDASSVLEMNADKTLSGRAWLLRAGVELQLGRLDEARHDAESALMLDPGSARAYLLRGVAESRTGDHRAAEQDFTAAMDHGLAGANILQRRSVERTALGDKAGAAADMARATAIDPHPGDAPAIP